MGRLEMQKKDSKEGMTGSMIYGVACSRGGVCKSLASVWLIDDIHHTRCLRKAPRGCECSFHGSVLCNCLLWEHQCVFASHVAECIRKGEAIYVASVVAPLPVPSSLKDYE